MCHILNKKCLMCSKKTNSSTSLCAEGMHGNICVITPMNEMLVPVKISHPRAGSRTYVDMKPYITTIMEKDLCPDCVMNMTTDTKTSDSTLACVVREMKTNSLMIDAEHINALIHKHVKAQT